MFEIIHGDTDRIPFGLGTYGSRSAAVGGSAIAVAVRAFLGKILEAIVEQLDRRAAGRPGLARSENQHRHPAEQATDHSSRR